MPELRAFARNLCGDAALADDLVQDTCLKAWNARDSFRPGSTARAWLFQILRNEFYQKQRRSWRSVGLDPEFAEQALVGACSLEASNDLHVMLRFLKQLPVAQYEALILIVAGGFSYDEAAEICGTSAGTIKSRVNRGRAALVGMFDDAHKAEAVEETDLRIDPMNAILCEIDRLRSRRDLAA